MKKTVLTVLIVFFVLPCAAQADFESEVIDLVNNERLAEGLHPLSYDADLTAAARGHSEDMGLQNYFSHTSLDGRTFVDRIEAAGYDYSYLGENIAAGQTSPEQVVDGWMNSTGHRANILSPNFCDIGVGYAYVAGSTYRHYWTQDFGKKAGVAACPDIPSFTISASAGPNGNIDPAGEVSVNQGGSLTFSITPDDGFSVDYLEVDGQEKDITTSYSFENVDRNHSISVTFESNPTPPTADAGSAHTVVEGHTVTLDASGSSDANDAVVLAHWEQTAGPEVVLSDENTETPTFVAPPVVNDTQLEFKLTVYDSGGLSDTDEVAITVTDNGISQLPDDIISFYSTTDRVLGIKTDSACDLTRLETMDPAADDITNTDGMPENLIYGLIDIRVKVAAPGGSATVTLYLPDPLPAGYRWYKYHGDRGWSDYSANVSLNTARDRVTLTLVDGGSGDDDGERNGIIVDPAGFGTAPAEQETTGDNADDGGGGGGGSGGCFIDTAAGFFK